MTVNLGSAFQTTREWVNDPHHAVIVMFGTSVTTLFAKYAMKQFEMDTLPMELAGVYCNVALAGTAWQNYRSSKARYEQSCREEALGRLQTVLANTALKKSAEAEHHPS